MLGANTFVVDDLTHRGLSLRQTSCVACFMGTFSLNEAIVILGLQTGKLMGRLMIKVMKNSWFGHLVLSRPGPSPAGL